MVPRRSPRSNTTSIDHIKSNTSSSLGVGGASASLASASSDADRYGNYTLPAAFQAPLKMAASGAPVRAGSAVLLCLLGLLGSLGESPLFWVVFGGAVAIIAAMTGGGGDGAVGEGSSPVAHFGFPAEFHLTNEEEGETAGIGERPQVRCVSCTVVEILGLCQVTVGTSTFVPCGTRSVPKRQDRAGLKEICNIGMEKRGA